MTELLSVKPGMLQHGGLASAPPPFSLELKQILATIGTLLHAHYVVLASQKTACAVECHIEWRPLPGAVATKNAIFLQPPVTLPLAALDETPAAFARDHRLVSNVDDRGGCAWRLMVERESDAAPFTDPEEKAGLLLFELFRNAFLLWQRLQARTQRLESMEALAHAASHAVILVDANNTIVFANRRAETLLAENAGLVRSHTRLTATHFDDAVRLQAALHYALRQQAHGGEDAAAPLISIRRTGAPHLYAAIVPVTAAEDDAGALTALYIADPTVDLSDAAGHTCRLHGLTQAETRLAKHLVGGMSLIAAATSMKIQPHTARAYLKQIFSKMDISRQAELVRLLMSSIVPLRTRFISMTP